jgi:hypothetical protein
MAESMVREALKKGMKTWIMASDRVRTSVAEIREGLEDVVVEARAEYENRGEGPAQPDAERDLATASTASDAVTVSPDAAGTDAADGANIGGAVGAGIGAAVGGPVGAAVGGAAGAGVSDSSGAEANGTVGGAAAGGAVGAAAGGPIGAVIGGAAGAVAGGTLSEEREEGRVQQGSSPPGPTD